MALVASVEEMEKQWGYMNEGGDRVRTDYRHMPIRKNPEITDDLPKESGVYRFDFLNDDALLERTRSLHKQYAVLEIHPAHNEGQRLRIHVSLSWVGDEAGKLALFYSDWSDVEFEFDCDKRAYVISSVKLGGI
jgi:hypothetical protein